MKETYQRIEWPAEMPMRLLGRLRDCEQIVIGCFDNGLEVEGRALRRALEHLAEVWCSVDALADISAALGRVDGERSFCAHELTRRLKERGLIGCDE